MKVLYQQIVIIIIIVVVIAIVIVVIISQYRQSITKLGHAIIWFTSRLDSD